MRNQGETRYRAGAPVRLAIWSARCRRVLVERVTALLAEIGGREGLFYRFADDGSGSTAARTAAKAADDRVGNQVQATTVYDSHVGYLTY